MACDVQDVWQQLRSRSGTPAGLDVGAVVALHAVNAYLCHLGSEVWVLPIGLRAAAPPGIPEYVDVWRKCIEAPADKVTVLLALLMPPLQLQTGV